MESESELKILGFKISPEPNVKLQIDSIIKKANKPYFLLLRHKRAGHPTTRLRDIYIYFCFKVLNRILQPRVTLANKSISDYRQK